MSLKNAIGGIALIAGTAIGAAVLALPVSTAHLGFIQTTAIYLTCWFFMTMGALYLLEANLFVGYGTNLISMVEKTLGSFGKYFTWVTYLILLYALTAAYLNGAGAWLEQGMGNFGAKFTHFESALIATALTLIVVFLGTAFTDWINRILMIALIGTFVTLLGATYQHVQIDLLFSQMSVLDFRPLPLIITAFGFAIVIPTLTEYLHGKPKQLLWVILIGSAIPLLVYIIWEIAITGIIPMEGDPGLLQIQHHGHPVTDISNALQRLLKNPSITKASSYFSFFALITSLLGVSLSLFDFLSDGLHMIKNKMKGRFVLALIAFVPPLGFILFYPHGFTVALSFAGIFVAILLGILPAMMVWQGRYHLNITSPLQIYGGKIALILTILFFSTVMCIEGYNQWMHFNGSQDDLYPSIQ